MVEINVAHRAIQRLWGARWICFIPCVRVKFSAISTAIGSAWQ